VWLGQENVGYDKINIRLGREFKECIKNFD
jgi:hypothetical protein